MYVYNWYYGRAVLDDCQRFAPWEWTDAERRDIIAAWRMGGEL